MLDKLFLRYIRIKHKNDHKDNKNLKFAFKKDVRTKIYW